MRADEGCVGSVEEVIVGTLGYFELRVVLLQCLRWHATESDDIERGSAVVDGDLDWDDLAHSGNFFDGGGVVLGQSGGHRAEAILSIDHEGGVVGIGVGGNC